MPDHAFRHAVSAGDPDLARQVVERFLIVRLLSGEVGAVEYWLDLISPSWYANEDAGKCRARATALRCNIACFQNDLVQAETLGNQALRDLQLDDLDFRAGVYGALGDTYRRNGH